MRNEELSLEISEESLEKLGDADRTIEEMIGEIEDGALETEIVNGRTYILVEEILGLYKYLIGYERGAAQEM